jgi:hypothetical protein
MSRRRLPTPTRRKHALTWEIRCRIAGRVVVRSLGTRDYDTALKRLPDVYRALLGQHESPSTAIRGPTPAPPSPPTADAPQPAVLPMSEACRRYRDDLLHSERTFRTEYAAAGVADPLKLAADYRRRLQERLRLAHARAVVHDFKHQDWFLTYLSKSGLGEVQEGPSESAECPGLDLRRHHPRDP